MNVNKNKVQLEHNATHRIYEDLISASLLQLNLNSLDEVASAFDKEHIHLNDTTLLILYQNRIYEFLHTINPEWLCSNLNRIPGLKRMFKSGALYYAQFDKQNVDIKSLKFPESTEIDLENIVECCGYVIAFRHFPIDTPDVLEIAFAPNYTKDMTNYVYDATEKYKEPGILYHICPKQIWENKISKTGIIPKTGNKHNRLYAPRAYFFTHQINFDAYAEDLRKGITNTKYKEYVNCNDYVVLKIDLNKIFHREQYHFYIDSEYNGVIPISVFTYETIHPKCIEVFDEIRFN